jgi:hypothetical protein
MTLKEKFDETLTYLESKRKVSECEKITDEFAIGFADWIRVCKMKGRFYDFENTQELLEIYKEEKGL